MIFGDKLRETLEQKEMQQKDFAKIMNISASSLNGYITNRRLPSIYLVRDFAKELGVSVDYLLDYEPENVALSPSENEIIHKLRSLPEEQRKIISSLIEMLSQK